ncbi:MAG: hypothetical protein WBA93_19770 [Microcoleaceae cyanobacterium]
MAVIKRITGHKSIQTLQEYIDVTPAEIAKVLEVLQLQTVPNDSDALRQGKKSDFPRNFNAFSSR